MTRTNINIILGVAALLVGAFGCGGSSSAGSGTSGKGGASGGSAGAGGATAMGNAGATGMGGSSSGSGGSGGATNCAPGAACTGTETCAAPCGGGTREIACFCDVNGVFACEACAPVDGGTGGSGGVDAGVPACPANPMGMACDTAGSMCETTCMNNVAQSCRCQLSIGGLDAGGTMRWRCQDVRCQ